jgi:hypothetical protein
MGGELLSPVCMCVCLCVSMHVVSICMYAFLYILGLKQQVYSFLSCVFMCMCVYSVYMYVLC